jgi:iron complex transport system substrate-binding protein
MKKLFLYLFITLVVALTGCHSPSNPAQQAKKLMKITDMAGREVEVPESLQSVICADMTATYFMYALAPELLSGRNTKASGSESLIMNERFTNLPVVGVVFFGKSTFNIEAAKNLRPDILLCPLFKHTTAEYITDYENFGAKMGVPVVMVALDLEKLPEAYRFMGKLIHNGQKADELADYIQETLGLAASVRKQIRDTVSVYIAEGPRGLKTIPDGSTHSQVIRMSGVRNCAKLDEAYGFKEMSISFEQILSWKPDYILINDRTNAEIGPNKITELLDDKTWQSLDAVKHNKILIVPTVPFNWIGRPPGINRLIGIRWLVSSLYPELAPLDMEKEVARFFSLFYHIQPSAEKIKEILAQTHYRPIP